MMMSTTPKPVRAVNTMIPVMATDAVNNAAAVNMVNANSGGDKPTMTSMSSMSLKEDPRLEENKIEETTTLNNEGTEKDEIVVKKSAANAQKSTHGK